jgi:hypothetical protein
MLLEPQVTEIRGLLHYTLPNKHTTSSIYSPYHSVAYTIYIDAFRRGISPDETYIVGTHCGTKEFNQVRVDEYIEYRTHKKTMNEIILKNYPGVNLSDKKAFLKYETMIYKKWFGDHNQYLSEAIS